MNLKAIISSIFIKKEASVIGVDIGMSAIKIVQIRKKKGRAVLETYGELSLGPYSGLEIGRSAILTPDKVITALKDIMREANVTSKSAGVSVPLQYSFITLIKLPVVDEKKLPEIIPLEARKYIPIPISEVLLDWWVIPNSENIPNSVGSNDQNLRPEGADALIVAIHNDALQKLSSEVVGAGLNTSFFEIELFSTLRSTLLPGVQTQVILDMGSSATKLYIVDRGVLKVSHTISRGSQDITLAISKSLNIGVAEAENIKRKYGLIKNEEYKELQEIIVLNLDYIFYEANRVILNYEKKFNTPIGKIILSGGGALLKGLLEISNKNFQTESVLADPFQKLETPAFLRDVLKEAGPEFTVAIGLALRRLAENE
ncbi:MAG: type IV pilus assembly protein PilM [bacterium]|nr:type IV pilus assembly protein PilM [bacterium]